jgi:AraC-like DNA-binding protein
MFQGKIYGCGRGAVRVDGRSQRAVARESGLSRETVLARSHLRGQGENKKHSVLCLCGMPEKLAHPVGIQDVHLTLCVLRDYNSRNKIRFQESPVHVLLKHDLENGKGVADGSRAEINLLDPLKHPLKIERCKPSEHLLTEREANVAARQCLVITIGLGSGLRSDSRLVAAFKILVGGNPSPSNPVLAPFLKPGAEVAPCRSKCATNAHFRNFRQRAS